MCPDIRPEEHLQQEHYDKIAVEYELHYSDHYSLQYRDFFINPLMHEGLDLKGWRVLDAMCGSGQTTRYLLAQGAEVTGLDISAEVLRLYCCKWPQTESIQASIFNNSIPDSSFDAVFIVGGLHHLHPEVARAVREIYRILKPGGWFGFTEPHAGSIPDLARKFWYRFDKLFEENEAAIDLEALEAEFARHFEFIHTRYCGNVAYLFVFSSMVFRIPPKFKKYYTPLLLRLEKLINQFQNKRLACFVVGQWRKIG